MDKNKDGVWWFEYAENDLEAVVSAVFAKN